MYNQSFTSLYPIILWTFFHVAKARQDFFNRPRGQRLSTFFLSNMNTTPTKFKGAVRVYTPEV